MQNFGGEHGVVMTSSSGWTGTLQFLVSYSEEEILVEC